MAGLDNYQMNWVVFRARDQHGKLIRRPSSLPPWVHVDADGMRIVKNPIPFKRMFRQVQELRGKSKAEAELAWELYQLEHPKLGRGGEPFDDHPLRPRP